MKFGITKYKIVCKNCGKKLAWVRDFFVETPDPSFSFYCDSCVENKPEIFKAKRTEKIIFLVVSLVFCAFAISLFI